MDRQVVYPGQIPLETDLLNSNKYAMMGLAKLAAAMFGTENTVANGFVCAPTSPASMQVTVSAGEVYSLQSVDGSAYSSIPADTTHKVLKQGVLLDQATLTLTAPASAGQSINYLVQVAFSEVDGGTKVLQYYNSSNPAQAYSGPNNSGATQPTVRQDTCALMLKSGAAATTGTQTTPSPDAGYVGLWVITVAAGQSTITAASIAQYANAPFINAGLLGLTPAFNQSPTVPTPTPGDTSTKAANMAALYAATAVGTPPASSISTQGINIGANYSNSLSMTITPQRNGYVFAIGKLNAGTNSASGNVGCQLSIDGASKSGDTTLTTQVHFGLSPVLKGVPVTLNFLVTSGATAPNIPVTYQIGYIFIPGV